MGKRRGAWYPFFMQCMTVLVGFVLAGILASGCASQSAKPGDAAIATLPVSAQCVTDADCRLLSDYCDGCACRALTKTDADPVCKGKVVPCFADPCQRKVAVCQTGTCVVAPS